MYLIGFFNSLVILNSSFVCSELIKGLLYIYLLQRPEIRPNHEMYAPVAQLDRVLDYESRGRGFESSPVRHQPSRFKVTNADISYASDLLVSFQSGVCCELLTEIFKLPNYRFNSLRSLAKRSAWNWKVLLNQGRGVQ